MVVTGYVVLKLHKYTLYYADWTNTRRKYRIDRLTLHNIRDLRRVFNGKTIVLMVNKEQMLSFIHDILGSVNTSKCSEVEDIGSASQILNFYLQTTRKKKSYYNYQREHWLTILSVINIHLLIHGSLPEDKLLKIIHRELVKYKRDITASALLDKFMSMNLYQRIDIGNVGNIMLVSHKHSMVSLPESKTD